ncbi:MAG TPA: peptidylprolyl isomerase [candidate division Zixibacteria bacterium]|nr:peptidylprolyl isomerase [candidate division Zixibacteria bacterium]
MAGAGRGRTPLIIVAALAALFAAGPAGAARDTVDRIVAVVGDKVILASELAGQMQLAVLQSKKQPKSEEEVEKLKREVLEEMISDQLFLVAAEQDTSVKVTDEEIDQALDQQVARIAANFPTTAEFEAALSQEGLTLRDLKKRYRDDIRGQLLKQRLVGRRLQSVSVSRHEVEAFYSQFRDSIPTQPEAVKLAHILLALAPAPAVDDSVKTLAAALRQRVLDGADFAALSARYSSGGAGANGGDLGWVSRDDVVEEFARAAFSLQPGDISGVVRTQFGYHVIQCEDRRDNQVRLRHILLAVQPTREDTLQTSELADSLIAEARAGGDFAQMAKAYSADDRTRATGGELGWFAVNELPVEFAAAVREWKTPGEIRGPVLTEFGIHILKLLAYQSEHEFTLENDYDRLKELARQEKTARMIEDWIDDIKARTYIDYRLGS